MYGESRMSVDEASSTLPLNRLLPENWSARHYLIAVVLLALPVHVLLRFVQASHGGVHLSLLIATMLLATLTDLRARRIANALTYTMLLTLSLLLLFRAFGGWLAPEQDWSLLSQLTLGEGLAGAGTGFFVLFVIYTLLGSGAGDVKIATVMGLGLGVMGVLLSLAYAYLIAGVAAGGVLLFAPDRLKPTDSGTSHVDPGAINDGESSVAKKTSALGLPMAPFYFAGMICWFVFG